MLTGNPGHLKGFEYVGLHRYFLTFCTDHRRHHFIAADRVTLVLEQILRVAGDSRFAIIAYCFMPDHVHLVLEAESDASNCLEFIKRAKQFSGFYFKRAFGVPLWQRYGWEHVLRDHETTLGVARYTLENPVRAGLVSRVEEYPYCGSTVYPVGHILEAVQMRPASRKSG